MTKRYCLAPDTLMGVAEYPDGDYVRASDYDALAEKLRETEIRLRMYGGHTANCAYHLSHYKGPVSQCDCMWTDLVPTVFAAGGT